jgi:hypothetical protein
VTKGSDGRPLTAKLLEYFFAVWLIGLFTADFILLTHGGGRIGSRFFIAQIVIFAISVILIGLKREGRRETPEPYYDRGITVGGTTEKKLPSPLVYAYISNLIDPFAVPVILILLWLRIATNVPLSLVAACRWLWLLTNIVVAYALQANGNPIAGLVLSTWICFDLMYSAVSHFRLTRAGVAALFLDHNDERSPLQILISAIFFAAAFGCIIFHIWCADSGAYKGITDWQDCVYFSVVTLATVGYGDIYPTHDSAKWACIAEIICGLTLLVVAINASMGAWLQRHQPAPGIHPISGGKLYETEELVKLFKKDVPPPTQSELSSKPNGPVKEE